jgi:hypothetical protein
MKRGYVIVHWGLTLLLAPVIFQAILIFLSESVHHVVSMQEVYLVELIVGFVCSIPTFIIYLFAFYYLFKYNIPSLIAKTILVAISVIGIFLTFYLLFHENMSSNIAFAYSFTSIVIGSLLKLNTNSSGTNKSVH